jgi:hypothetical protein
VFFFYQFKIVLGWDLKKKKFYGCLW